MEYKVSDERNHNDGGGYSRKSGWTWQGTLKSRPSRYRGKNTMTHFPSGGSDALTNTVGERKPDKQALDTF